MTSSSTLLTLPSELIEAVLICSCSPRTVTSVAQTCRALHTLVYASPDSHLWRGLYLTIWDDPHPALEHRSFVDPSIDPAAWNWGTEYRGRVSADRWLKAWRRNICLAGAEILTGKDANTDTEWYITTLSSLTTVLNTLLTLQPFPTTPLTAPTSSMPAISPYPMGNTGSGVGDRRERISSAPLLPPLLTALANGISTSQDSSQSAVRVERMVYGPHATRARAEPAPIPTPSLPPQLVRTLLASYAVGVRGLPVYTPSLPGGGYWGDNALGYVFHRIICMTGFVPIPPPLVSTSTSTSEFVSDHTRAISVDTEALKNRYDTGHGFSTQENGNQDMEQGHCESYGSMRRSSGKAFPTPSQQYADARTLARRRVYDMRYIRADRLWGPFQLVTKESLGVRPRSIRQDVDKGRNRASTGSAASRRGGARRLGMLTRTLGMGIEPDGFDSTSDDNGDEDWHSSADTGKEPSSSDGRSRGGKQTNGGRDKANANPDGETVLTEPEHPLIPVSTVTSDTVPTASTTPTISSRRTRRSNPRLPPNSSISPRDIKPQHLRPDYAYLASVRIVVEANLRELFGMKISDNVEGVMSEVKAGGVGMFWEDEDEILRAQAESSEPSSSSTTTPCSIPVANIGSTAIHPAEIFSRFQNLEVARLGSACGYWNGWIERQKSAMRNVGASSSSSSKGDVGTRRPRIVAQRDQLEKSNKGMTTTGNKGKGKEGDDEPTSVSSLGTGLEDWELGPEGEACEGWDWAGVAGTWRRCVCWMDYRELLFFNVCVNSSPFDSSRSYLVWLDQTESLSTDAQEVYRIIPMELRITKYTRAGLMPVRDATPAHDHVDTFTSNRRSQKSVRSGYFRPPPVIHFSGSSIGSDRSVDEGRTVKGSVQLIGGGEVRWHMDTYPRDLNLPGASTPEWSSEAVQVGGIGSAVGVLGMWTGAGHQIDDPLGPFWAWKVAYFDLQQV